MEIRVSVIEEHEQLNEWLTVRNELEPDEPLLLEQLLVRRAAEPERRELIALSNDDVAAIGTIGPKGSPTDLAYGFIGVRNDWKQCGADLVLLSQLRQIAGELGRSRLELWAREDDGPFIALLQENGFHEVAREGGLARDIPGAPLEALSLPRGFELRRVAERSEFGAGAYEVAEQSWRDIPGETGIERREAWLRLHVEQAADGAVVVLHEERVVGFAGLHQLAGEGLYENGLLAVLPEFRRHGIARALKVAQLQWLIDHGARRVVTWNSETNEPA
ncbi:MAG TPA: GNAT family N-acetyltransferase, partial [Acidimicrobiales bacterium]